MITTCSAYNSKLYTKPSMLQLCLKLGNFFVPFKIIFTTDNFYNNNLQKQAYVVNFT